MRDFLPADKARRERVLGVIRETYRAHGFDEIETPVVEDSSRLHAGLGGDNEKLAFGILKRGLTTDDMQKATDALDLADLGLRFDLTVPLARFYASHRGELPTVFRAIQIAPVWRAERPQKGRFRQFMQCDIDIIGEAGPLAEVELITATLATLAALGLHGTSIRINDRRLLLGMLDVFGFAGDERNWVLITIDKRDKINDSGVIAELRERGATPSAVDALAEFLARPPIIGRLPFGRDGIAAALPPGVDESVIAELAAIGDAVRATTDADAAPIEFDPFLVRGMGYYTGTIIEVAHPDFGYSLGGGGRYDGMIGRFLGHDVPATGFSLGFERIVDLVDLPDSGAADAVALIHDGASAVTLAALKSALISRGSRVRLERRTRNLTATLDALAASGYTRFAFVSADTRGVDDLELRDLAGTER